MGKEAVVGRLAPSPTGALHLGHATSFLAAWWSARSQGGRVVLRFEDIDAERVSDEFIQAGLRDLAWLGIDWDGEPIVQSTRRALLNQTSLKMQDLGLAYPCTCTRRELRDSEEQPGAPHGHESRYPGTCRDRFLSLSIAEAETGRQAGLRFRVRDGDVTFEDRTFGTVVTNVSSEVGDFLILRRNKIPAYQLAIVVDDHLDQVTEVVRGRDLLSSTARQLLIADALGIPRPSYAHVPLVCDSTGRRLAKRDADRGISELRAQGVKSERIIDYVARSLGQGPARSAQEVVARFDWKRVPITDIRLPSDISEAL
jgi:glutamyl-tRNA synthetase